MEGLIVLAAAHGKTRMDMSAHKAGAAADNAGIDIPADPSNPDQPSGWGVETKPVRHPAKIGHLKRFAHVVSSPLQC